MIRKKLTFKLDISRTKSFTGKILSQLNSAHEITFINQEKTAFQLKSILTSFDLNTLTSTSTISRMERDILKILSPLNSTQRITYRYRLRQHPPPSGIDEKKYIRRYCSGQSILLN